MSPLEIFAVLISLIGVGLTVIRNMWCWLFNFFAFVLYAYLFYEFKLYGETILQFFFMVVNFYGFYYWLKGKQQDHDIRIEPIAVQTAIIQMIIAAVGGLVFGLVLKNFTDAACRCSTHSLQHLACLQLTGPAESILRHGSFGYLSILFMSACLSIKICF